MIYNYLNHKLIFSDWGQLLVAVEMLVLPFAADPPSTSEPLSWENEHSDQGQNHMQEKGTEAVPFMFGSFLLLS